VLLAAVGLYGVLAYVVDSRHRELALRAALGAEPRALAGWAVRQAAVPVAVGLVAGLALALGGGKLLSSLLFGVSRFDLLSLLAVTLGIGAVAVAASLVPSRRALTVDPASALREE